MQRYTFFRKMIQIFPGKISELLRPKKVKRGRLFL